MNRPTDVTQGTGVVPTDSGYAPHDWGAGDSVPGWEHLSSMSDSFSGALQGQHGDIVQIGVDITQLAGDVGHFLYDPAGFVIEAGLAFLIDFIQPLEDLIGLATGNAERMEHEINKWNTVRQAMGPLSDEVRNVANETLASWLGEASETGKIRIHELAIAIDNIDHAMANLTTIMELAKALAETLHDALISLLADFIKPVVYYWIAAIAAAGPTFGASTAGAASYTTVQYAFTVVKFGQRMQQATTVAGRIFQVCDAIYRAVDSLGPVLTFLADFAANSAPHLKTPLSVMVKAMRGRSCGAEEIEKGCSVTLKGEWPRLSHTNWPAEKAIAGLRSGSTATSHIRSATLRFDTTR
jgi:hypothetical protein